MHDSDYNGAQILVLYRSCSRENGKPRPSYYSKELALASYLRATARLGARVETVFVNDGPISDELLATMNHHGSVRAIEAGSTRRSYRAALKIAASLPGHPCDLIWFAEDDYLYSGASFQRLSEAVDRIPAGDYFAMFGRAAINWRAESRTLKTSARPGALGDAAAFVSGGTTWFRGVSTTSSFGMRPAVFHADYRLLMLAPFTGGGFDHRTCLAVQGISPVETTRLRDNLKPGAGWSRRSARGLIRRGFSLRANRLTRNRRTLMAPDPELILHMEGVDHVLDSRWTTEADDVRGWAQLTRSGVDPVAPIRPA